MRDDDSIFGATPEGLDRLVFEAWQHPEADGQAQPTVPAQMLLEQPGGRIGRYKLLRVLGEGGMGIVYLAEQERPVKRQVALKVIKPGMDSKRVLARFEAEQQALALMEHAHVARVHDAGLTPSGRPYFVMEHVRGIPITEYGDKHRLTVDERLRLFLHVCEAVQHAHQKGIIHRDIKPSNILVATEDNQPVPKVIDFGVARAISQPLTERTLYTEEGQLVGTPEYMSPEQADAGNQDIDTRTDVYSLGVVLYELVAGVLPFDPHTLRDHGIEGVRKVICEQDPQTPSTRLSRTSAEESARSAQQRRTNLRQLQRTLRGDLDWISLKAMEKDRTRRYGSAGELATDIRRHLSHEPVAAGRPSLPYKARKFVRRNRALVTGLAAVLAVLVGGVIVSFVFAVKADRARKEATAVAKFLQNYVFRAMDAAERGGLHVSVKEILDAASQEVSSQFGDSPLQEASIQKTLGALYANVACFEDGQRHLMRALDLFTREVGREDLRTVEVLDELGHLYWGWWRYREAELYLSDALEARTRLLGPNHLDTLNTRRWLGWTYYAQGYAKKAERSLAETYERTQRMRGNLAPETMECLVFHGCALLQHGRYAEAETTLTRALAVSETALSPRHPLVVYPTALLGRLYSRQGRYEKAQQLLGQALQISREAWGEHNGGTFHNVAALAENYARQGRIAEAESLLLEAVQRGEQTEEPQSEVAVQTLPYPGFFYLWRRRYRAAEESVKKALTVSLDAYGAEHPITFLDTVAMGIVYREQGRYAEAEEKLRQAVNFTRHYLTEGSIWTAAALHELAATYQRQGKNAEAERLHLEVLDLQRSLLAENHWHTLGTIKDLIALHVAWGKPQEARKWLQVLQGAYADQSAASGNSRATTGTIRHDAATGTYTLTAPPSAPWTIEKELNFSLPEPSSETWHVCDDLHFACKTLHGDGSITAKIESLTPSHPGTQVGLTIRNTLEPTSPHVSVVITPLGDVVLQHRPVELGATRSSCLAGTVQLPHWLRLIRTGGLLTAQHSGDGVSWEPIQDNDRNRTASIRIPASETACIGLDLTSHDQSQDAEAHVSNVTILGTASPPGPFGAFEYICLGLSPSADYRANRRQRSAASRQRPLIRGHSGIR